MPLISMLTTSELSLVRPSPVCPKEEKRWVSRLLVTKKLDENGPKTREVRTRVGGWDQGQDAATSTGDFDVGSGQADGRHAHVEADVLVDEDALGRRLLQVT